LGYTPIIMFPTYVEHPRNVKFEGQDPDEKILLLLRAHPVTNLPWVFFVLILFFVPFLIPTIATLTGFNLSVFPQTFQIIFFMIDYLLIFSTIYDGLLYWYFNVTIITNKKLIDIDFVNLLYKSVEIAPLHKIEEADSITAGLFGSFFNFGDIAIQTAGAHVAIKVKNIIRPSIVADIILDMAGKPLKQLEEEVS